MKTWILEHAFSLIAGPVIGVLVFYTQSGLKRIWTWLDTQNPFVQRTAATMLAIGVTAIANALGVATPDACITAGTGMDALTTCVTAIAEKHWLTAALGAGFAMLTHRVLRPPKIQ